MDMTIAPAAVDEQRLVEFAGKAAGDLAAAMGVLLAYMGDQTGIYRALRDTGRCGVATLAGAAGVDERYLLEWLSAQAASGYIELTGEWQQIGMDVEILPEQVGPVSLTVHLGDAANEGAVIYLDDVSFWELESLERSTTHDRSKLHLATGGVFLFVVAAASACRYCPNKMAGNSASTSNTLTGAEVEWEWPSASVTVNLTVYTPGLL